MMDDTKVWLFVAGVVVAVIGGLCTWLWRVVQDDIARAHRKTENARDASAQRINELSSQINDLRESVHADVSGLREEFASFSGRVEQYMRDRNGHHHRR